MTGIGRVTYLLALLVSVTLLYSLLLGLTGLLFFSPGFFYTWLFNRVVQMARYPLTLYPGWLRLFLTWVLMVGLMTTGADAYRALAVLWRLGGAGRGVLRRRVGVVSPGIAALC